MPPKPNSPPRAWQRMLSGRRLDLLDPSPLDIEIEDIARGLARVARWNGQTSGDHAFSVAEHSVVVLDIFSQINPKASRQEKLTALLHDAPEYVIGDMISPFKSALGLDYKAFEQRLDEAVNMRFGLPAKTPATLKKKIKKADLYCAWFEAIQIAGFDLADAQKYFTEPPSGLQIKIDPLPVKAAEKLFIDAFNTLAL